MDDVAAPAPPPALAALPAHVAAPFVMATRSFLRKTPEELISAAIERCATADDFKIALRLALRRQQARMAGLVRAALVGQPIVALRHVLGNAHYLARVVRVEADCVVVQGAGPREVRVPLCGNHTFRTPCPITPALVRDHAEALRRYVGGVVLHRTGLPVRHRRKNTRRVTLLSVRSGRRSRAVVRAEGGAKETVHVLSLGGVLGRM